MADDSRDLLDGDRLLTSAEVAAEFRVDPRTVSRWALAGKITSTKTPGGHRRYRRSQIQDLLVPEEVPDDGATP